MQFSVKMKICHRLLIFELSDCTLRIFRGYDFCIFILLFFNRYWGFSLGPRVSPPVCLVVECPLPPPQSKDNLTLLKYPNIICLYARGQERSCSGVFATFVCKPVLNQYIIRMLQYIHMGIFKRLVWFYLQIVS